MPLGVPRYIVPNVRVRSMVGRLLTEEQWQELHQARDLPAMLTILQDTTYGPQLGEFQTTCPPCEMLESRLNAHMSLRFARVIDITPEPGKQLVILLKQLFEVDNLKTILRGLHAGESAEQVQRFLFPLGRASSFDVKALLSARDIPELVLKLRNTPYGVPLQQGLARYQQEQSLFPLEVALDLDYYRRLWQTVEALQGEDRRWAELLVGTWLDIVNVLWSLRYRYYYHLSMVEIINYTLPYGYKSNDSVIRAIAQGEDVQSALNQVWGVEAPQVDTHTPGWLPKLEVDLYRYLNRLARRALVGYPFHLGVTLAYLILKRFEVSDLKVLAESKAASTPVDVYRDYLVHAG